MACVLLLLTTGGAAQSSQPRSTRGTAHNEGTGAYDKCSHPFHAWMCQAPSRPRTLSVTTPTPPRGSRFPGGSAPTTLPSKDHRPTPTPSIPLPTPQSGQFFSPEAAPSRVASSNISPTPFPVPQPTESPTPKRGSILFPQPAPPPSPPPPSPPPRPLPSPSTSAAPARTSLPSKANLKDLHQGKIYDQCSHPFHAWLCSSPGRPRSTQRQPKAESRPTALPTQSHTQRPTLRPTPRPTPHPTHRPTPRPTQRATPEPTQRPTPRPTQRATPEPTQRPTPRPTQRPTPRPTAKPYPRPGPFPEASSPSRGSLLLSKTLRPTPPTTTTTTPRPYNICLHPFHSWRCEGPKLRPKPSNLGKVLEPAPAQPNTRTKIQQHPTHAPPLPEPTWDGADPCTHAFHSWLCTRPRPRPRPRPKQEPVVDPVLDPAASFPNIVPALAPNNLPAPTPPPTPPQVTTTQAPPNDNVSVGKPLPPPDAPQEINDPEPQPEPEPSLQDVCSHPFHSFLCSSPRTTTAQPPPPVKEPVAAPAFLPPPVKVRPQRERGSLPAPQPPHDPQCDHPFHAWLCDQRTSKSKKQQIRGHTGQQEHSKILNTVSDPTASSQTHSPSNRVLLPHRPVPTVPPQQPPVRRRQAQLALSLAPSTTHLVSISRPSTMLAAPLAFSSIDLVSAGSDIIFTYHPFARNTPPLAEGL